MFKSVLTKGTLCAGIATFVIGLATAQNQTSARGKLKFINQVVVPHNKSFRGTTIGGLSGIDYDPTSGVYYLICDDRSTIQPARFYTARIAIGGEGIDSVQFVDVTTLLRSDGTPFPAPARDPSHTTDPESIRYNPLRKEWTWASEGERIIGAKDTVLVDPAVYSMRSDGLVTRQWFLPDAFRMTTGNAGPRKNGAFEGLTFDDSYQTLYAAMEEPLLQDGERTDLHPGYYPNRLIAYQTTSHQPLAQYVYLLEPVAFAPTSPTAFKINGVPEILWVGNNKMLVLERSYTTGRLQCTIRIYLADLTSATNVNGMTSLREAENVKPISKELLLNMDTLGFYIDNVEGITWGPRLPNGKRSLILISDNNFEPLEKTQFFLFEWTD